jgi:hypothetical protein
VQGPRATPRISWLALLALVKLKKLAAAARNEARPKRPAEIGMAVNCLTLTGCGD